MKIKLFHYRRWQKPLEDFEKEVNDFMATVEVVDVKYSSSSFGDSSSMDIIDGVLVVYKWKDKTWRYKKALFISEIMVK